LRWAAPTLVAALLAAAYVIISPSSADLAAHLFRAEMFRQQGFSVWNNYWYSGNAVLGYSVLFPAVSATLTPQLAAALATTGTATVFTVLSRRHFGERGWVGAMLFGAATAADLFSGRLTFAFGALPALAAILALDSDQPSVACGMAAVSALCSPVAALFAALAAAGFALGGVIAARGAATPERAGADTGQHAAVGALRVAWPGFAVIVASLALLPRAAVRLRAGVGVYAVATLALYMIPTPIGSNIARLGTLVALPLTALVWWGQRPRALALVFLPLLYVGWSPAFRDGIAGDKDNTTSTAYYAPLLSFLEHQASAPDAEPFRTEIPFTRFHWEAFAVASRFSLARGWERQLDIHDNPIFYGSALTPVTYDRWLHDNAVRFVAVSDADPDYSAKAETKLIDRRLPYLRLVFRSRHWRVYEVDDAAPIVQGPATLQTLAGDSLTLHANRAASVIVHLRFTPYWALARGSGCVAPDGNATRLTLRRAGEVRLVTRFSLGRIGADSPRCS
jgi:hypothetical protein